MRHFDGRRLRRTNGPIRSLLRLAALLAAVCFAAGGRAESSAGATAPRWEWLPSASGEHGIQVFFPAGDPGVPRRVTVLLHGMCGHPENECPWFAPAVTRDSWLVCPRAPLACPGGGATWSYRGRSETVEAAVAALKERYPGRVDDDEGRTLIGFSLGAFVAADIAHRDAGRWSELVLIGAKVSTNATRLEKNGIGRVLLASGDYDMARPHMVAEARRLRRAGMPSTFMTLGPVGHRFAEDMDRWTEAALGWLRSAGPEAPRGTTSQPR